MRRAVSAYDPSVPLVNRNTGSCTDSFNFWIKQVTDSGLLIGDGTPEGVVESQQGSMYMDESGIAGAVMYIKQLTNIGGDRTKGWVAIG